MLSLQTIKDIEQELNRSVEILLKGGDLDAVLKEAGVESMGHRIKLANLLA